jgi:hypothetical protein
LACISKTKTCFQKPRLVALSSHLLVKCRLNDPARLQPSLARRGAGIAAATELIALPRAFSLSADQTALATPVAIKILS